MGVSEGSMAIWGFIPPFDWFCTCKKYRQYTIFIKTAAIFEWYYILNSEGGWEGQAQASVTHLKTVEPVKSLQTYLLNALQNEGAI